MKFIEEFGEFRSKMYTFANRRQLSTSNKKENYAETPANLRLGVWQFQLLWGCIMPFVYSGPLSPISFNYYYKHLVGEITVDLLHDRAFLFTNQHCFQHTRLLPPQICQILNLLRAELDILTIIVYELENIVTNFEAFFQYA